VRVDQNEGFQFRKLRANKRLISYAKSFSNFPEFPSLQSFVVVRRRITTAGTEIPIPN